jgi:hypothetical protein
MKVSTFVERAQQHDERAISLVDMIFSRYGFSGFRIGAETDSQDCWELLLAQSDPTSIMLRFRPDRVQIKPGARAVLCEVKSEAQGHPNFAIEFYSWLAATMWNRSGHHVMYALADLRSGKVSACWAEDIPPPFVVRVPRRWDHGKHISRLQREAHWAELLLVEHKGGSGTPYFLVPKNSEYLWPLDMFIETQVTDPRP